MANCPVCKSEIEITSQHYGTLYSCPKCSAVFFVDWGGQPEASPGVAPENFPIENSSVNSESFAEKEIPNLETQYGQESLVAALEGYQEQRIEDLQKPDQAEVSAYDFSQPLGAVENSQSESADLERNDAGNDSSDLSDIADFGNSDIGQAAFNYTLTITGIDSGVVRTQIQEALADSKFGWDVNEVMAQIKGGVLKIRSINAVKASILVQRVKYLPVEIRWRQDVLSNSV